MQCSSILHPKNPIFALNIANNAHSRSFVKHNSKCSFPVAAHYNRFQLKKSIANSCPQFLVNNKDNTAARFLPVSTSTRVFCMSESEETSPENENSSTQKIHKMIPTIIVQGLKRIKLVAASIRWTKVIFTYDDRKIFGFYIPTVKRSRIQAKSKVTKSSQNQKPRESKNDVLEKRITAVIKIILEVLLRCLVRLVIDVFRKLV